MDGPTPQTLIAICFLAVILALLLAAIVWRMRQSPLSPLQAFFWRLASLIVKFQWRAELPEKLPLPEGQGAIIISNHRSSIDPFFIQVLTKRKVHTMVAREYCEHPAFGPLLKICEVIPVSRGGIDTAATKTAIRFASAGELVGMFPEGRINMTDELLLPGRPGVALIALKAKVPILPCYIEGSPYRGTAWSPFLMRARVKLHVGELIDLSEYYGREQEDGVLAEITLRCLKAIAELAGQPNFEPKMAGRNWKPTSEQIEADLAANEAKRKQNST